MANKIIWNQKVIDELEKKLGNNLELVGALVESEATKEITAMGRVDTGRLKNSITHETDKKGLVTRIGTNVEYAPFVELGTYKMQPAPFLRYALYKNEKQIIDILSKEKI